MKRKALAAVAQTTVTFNADEWTTVDLSTVGPNMTEAKPGSDLHSFLIECKFNSLASAYVVFRDDPGVGANATDGWEIEPGAVLGDESYRGMRFMSFRSSELTGAVKIMIRADESDVFSPWV